MVASHTPPTEDLALNPGMCPEWESNQGPFDSQASTQSTEAMPARAISCLLGNSHSNRCKEIAHCGFDVHSLICDAEHVYLVVICVFSLEQCLFRSSASFYIRLFFSY